MALRAPRLHREAVSSPACRPEEGGRAVYRACGEDLRPRQLVDEYDKVVSDNALGENVGELRDTLRGFYQVLKAKGELLRFVFMTGVTKYAKMGVFSGLNNLNDITLDPGYATMLGYTQKELEENFAGSIE